MDILILFEDTKSIINAEVTIIKERFMEKIIKIRPAYKDYLWGGTKLREYYGKNSSDEKIAESWEISCHPDGLSYIAEGEYRDMSLADFVEQFGEEALGEKGNAYESFPILCKFIDAKQKLSIQVHPDDAYAKAAGLGNGKTELWYIVECEENAYIYFGVSRTITKEEFKKRIEENTVLEVLNKVPVRKGDCFLLEAGTVHAIGPGAVIYEVQQNSNCTFRVYDYDRRDADGNPRRLHIREALEVSRLEKKDIAEPKRESERGKTILGQCDYFTAVKYECQDRLKIENCKESFRTLTIVEGNADITIGHETKKGEKGESFFVPANAGEIEVQGNNVFILVQT